MTFSQLIYHLLGFFLGNQTLFLELFYPLFFRCSITYGQTCESQPLYMI